MILILKVIQKSLKKDRYNLKMELFILDSGLLMAYVMEEEYKFEQMDLNMKVIGRETKQMAEGDQFMLMEMFLKGNDLMIKHMAMEHTFIQMGQNMLDNEKKINNMDKEQRFGLMELNMKEHTRMVKNTEKDIFTGQMDLFMKESLKIIIFMAKEFIHGLTVVNISVNEKIIKWMAKVCLHGKTEDVILEIIQTIKSKDMEFFNDLMEEDMKECDQMENNMAKVFILLLMVRGEKVNGKMEEEQNGHQVKMVLLTPEKKCFQNIFIVTFKKNHEFLYHHQHQQILLAFIELKEKLIVICKAITCYQYQNMQKIRYKNMFNKNEESEK